jgi:hypothetical protein
MERCVDECRVDEIAGEQLNEQDCHIHLSCDVVPGVVCLSFSNNTKWCESLAFNNSPSNIYNNRK